MIATLQIRPVLRQRIQEVQRSDSEFAKIMKQIQQGVDTPFSIQEGTLMLGNRLYVPDTDGLRKEILDEVHNVLEVMHLGTTKNYINRGRR